jgi:cytoskeleton protein RodZ
VPDSSQTAQSGGTIPSAPALPAAPETEPDVIQQAAAPITATRIHIDARLDTWIKITDHNGRTVLNRVLVAGEGYDVPDEPGLKMITGNAGGMDILVDGAAIAPLGEPGKVRRDVELDPEKLKAGTAIPQ